MRANQDHFSFFATVLVLGILVLTSLAAAQTSTLSRISDKDLETLMNNLKEDAKSFRPRFDSAIQKSTIRKTSQAKDAKNLASLLQRQTAALLNDFKKTKKGDAVLNVLSSAGQIEKLGTRTSVWMRKAWVGIRFEPTLCKIECLRRINSHQYRGRWAI